MVLRAEQIFDKVCLDRGHPSDFIDYISDAVERELVSKFIDQLISRFMTLGHALSTCGKNI